MLLERNERESLISLCTRMMKMKNELGIDIEGLYEGITFSTLNATSPEHLVIIFKEIEAKIVKEYLESNEYKLKRNEENKKRENDMKIYKETVSEIMNNDNLTREYVFKLLNKLSHMQCDYIVGKYELAPFLVEHGYVDILTYCKNNYLNLDGINLDEIINMHVDDKIKEEIYIGFMVKSLLERGNIMGPFISVTDEYIASKEEKEKNR